MGLSDLANTVSRQTGGKVSAVTSATFARRLVNKSDQIAISGDNIPGTVGALLDIVTPVTPLTGASQSMSLNGANETIYITPAGTIAALTVVFPSAANSRIGQIKRIVSTQTVTALTVTSTGLTLVGTALTAMVANTVYSWQKVAASTWVRLP